MYGGKDGLVGQDTGDGGGVVGAQVDFFVEDAVPECCCRAEESFFLGRKIIRFGIFICSFGVCYWRDGVLSLRGW